MNTNAAHQIPVHRQRRRISRQEMLRRKRAIRRRKRITRFFRISVAVLLLLTAVSFWQDYGGEILPTVNHLYYQLTARYDLPVSKYDFAALQEENETTFAESLSSVDADAENITEALSELVKNNAEAADFVADYPNRQNYLGQSIDLTHDVIIGQVPLFLQWDKRWGYEQYGDNFMAVTGCGPTCLSMVYSGLTGKTDMNPYEVAKRADAEGYYVNGEGSLWTIMETFAGELGLHSESIMLDENTIKAELAAGKPIICVVGPGTFTDNGHFMVLTGVSQDGKILLHDPNSKANSNKEWDYAELASQIQALWAYSVG